MFLVGRQRDRVRYDQLLDLGLGNAAQSGIRQDGMGHAGVNVPGSEFLQCLGSFAQRTGRIHDIIHHDGDLVLHIADQVHDFRHTRFRPSLVDDGNSAVEAGRNLAGPADAAQVRRNNDHFL